MVCTTAERRTTVCQVDAGEAWRALLRGEWVVTDHPFGPQFHTILCRRTPRGAPCPLLSNTAMALARRRARGALIKALAADFDRSAGGVSAQITSVMRALKLRGEAHLVALLGGPDAPGAADLPVGLEAALVDGGVEAGLTLVYPRPVWRIPTTLSSAERDIVLRLIDGASYDAVARSRGTSPRTIASQVASVFRKLKVQSQIALFNVLLAREPGA